MLTGACKNQDCPRFEYPVPLPGRTIEEAAAKACSSCGWNLLHESGLTFGDAVELAVERLLQSASEVSS